MRGDEWQVRLYEGLDKTTIKTVYIIMEKIVSKSIALLLFFSALLFLSCDMSDSQSSDTDDSISDSSNNSSNNSNQPEADSTGLELGRLVGFWDFNSDGSNSISHQAADWSFTSDISFTEDAAVFPVRTDNENLTQDDDTNYVRIDEQGWDDSKGIHSYYYFSGALRFRVPEVEAAHLLTFGQVQGYLRFDIRDGKIEISFPGANLLGDVRIPRMAQGFRSRNSVAPDTWHVLYFRIEEFAHNSERPSGNKVYVQIDNNGEEVFDYSADYFRSINDSIPGLDNWDRTMCFANMNNNLRFAGSCDWVMLTNGRMSPGNAQYYLLNQK
jgi:hypothetical protein